MLQHDIVRDVGGFNSRERFTCRTCAVTHLRQPYMGDETWQAIVDAFIAQHPGELRDETAGKVGA